MTEPDSKPKINTLAKVAMTPAAIKRRKALEKIARRKTAGRSRKIR